MGNCSNCPRKRKQCNTREHEEDAEEGDRQPNEDVTYASIDHSSAITGMSRATTETECEYATVKVPRALLQRAESDASSREDCAADDYVTMS